MANAIPNVGGGMTQGANPLAALSSGYNHALGNLNKSMKLLQGSNQSQLMQAQQGLQQNQGKVQQGLINSGLGNTTVAQTMQQAPLATYNQQIQGIHDSLANQQVGVLGKGADVQMQGGNAMSQILMQMEQQRLQQEQMKRQFPITTANQGAFGSLLINKS